MKRTNRYKRCKMLAPNGSPCWYIVDSYKPGGTYQMYGPYADKRLAEQTAQNWNRAERRKLIAQGKIA